MPLIHSKSKKAFKENVEAEMHANPGPEHRAQNLAIAYSVKRKAAKKKASGGTVESGNRDMNMADGGRVHTGPGGRPATEDTHGPTGPTGYRNRNKSSDLSGGQRNGPQGYPKYQEQAQNEKGVHTPVSGVTGFPGGKGTSQAGDFVKDRYAGKPTFEAGADHPARKEHAKVMEESKKIKPKLQGLAEGGAISAKTEKRPMPEDLHDDAVMEAHNRAKKALIDDGWTDKPTERQAQSNNGRMVKPIKHPRMVGSSVFQTKLRDEEDDLQTSEAPASDKEQPDADMNERDPKKQGKGPDMSKPHTTAKAYAEGGRINNEVSFHDSEEDEDPNESPIRESYMSPSEKEFMSKERMAPMLAEGGEPEPEDESYQEMLNRMVREAAINEKVKQIGQQQKDKMQAEPKGMAEGGHIEEHEDNYADDGHHDSIAAAIMARRDRLHAEIDSGAHDLDSAVRMAEGGEVDLSINADEEPNNEDQMSFEALKKENYSETPGLEELDQPHDSNLMGDEREDESENKEDRVSSIRSKMMAKRQFKSR